MAAKAAKRNAKKQAAEAKARAREEAAAAKAIAKGKTAAAAVAAPEPELPASPGVSGPQGYTCDEHVARQGLVLTELFEDGSLSRQEVRRVCVCTGDPADSWHTRRVHSISISSSQKYQQL